MNRILRTLLLLSVILSGCNINTDVDKRLKVTVFGLVDADSILISDGEIHILIDAGEKDHGPLILEELKARKIKQLDALILSHPDKDHIGGASLILEVIEVKQLIQSSLQRDTALQNDLNVRIKENKISTIRATKTDIHHFGDIKIKVFAPSKLLYTKSNNYSLILYIEYADKKLLFAGDSEAKRLNEALTYNIEDIDFYKVAHHGRENSSSANFIKKIKPKIAVITSDHGEDGVVHALEAMNSQILYTSNGNVNLEIGPSKDKDILVWQGK